jgi:hypothetical protein
VWTAGGLGGVQRRPPTKRAHEWVCGGADGAGEARSLVLIQFTSPNVIHEIRYQLIHWKK